MRPKNTQGGCHVEILDNVAQRLQGRQTHWIAGTSTSAGAGDAMPVYDPATAEAISDAVEGSSRIARRAFSVPVIKVAGFAVGTRRAASRLRGRSGATDVEVLTPINRGRRRA